MHLHARQYEPILESCIDLTPVTSVNVVIAFPVGIGGK